MNRDLDKAIAKELGYTVYHYDKDYSANRYYMLMDPDYEPVRVAKGERESEESAWVDCPHFHHGGHNMLKLISEMKKSGFDIIADSFIAGTGEVQYSAIFTKGVDDEGFQRFTSGAGLSYGKTMPEAVARAAYHALTGKEWRE